MHETESKARSRPQGDHRTTQYRARDGDRLREASLLCDAWHSRKIRSGGVLEHADEEQKHADQIAECIAIESYREMITFIGQRDPTTRRLLESILAQEEQHAEDLVDLLEDLPKD